MSTVKARVLWLASLLLLASTSSGQPTLLDLAPADGSVIGSRTGVLTGRAPGATLLRIDGEAVSLGGNGGFSYSFTLAEGASALTLYAEDAGGNTSQVHHLEVDTLAPAIVVTAPAQNRLASSPVTVAGTVQEAHLSGVTVRGSPAELSGGTFSASVTLAEGAQNVAIVATDTLGHSSTVTLVLTLDSQAPVITVSENGGPFSGGIFARAVTPQISFSDASQLSTEILLDGAAYSSGTPISSAGAHQLAISATDAVGWTTTREIDFTLDWSAPTFGAISPAAGSLVASAVVTLQVEAAGAASVRVGSLEGSAAGNLFTIGPIALAEGQQTLLVEAFDAAGNRAERAHSLIRDTTAPSLTVETPTSGSTVTASPVAVAGQASDPRLSSVKVNGALASLAGSSFAASASLAEGANSLLVEATDAAGNTTAQTINLTLDSSAPTFEVEVNGVTLVGGETFAGAITPTLGLGDPAATVTATLDGAAFSFGAAVSGSGSHQLSVTVSHNGLSSSRLFVFTIDSDPPVFLSLLPAEGSLTAAASVTLEGRVGNAVSLTLDGAPAPLVGEVWSSAPIALAEGPRTFLLRAVAESGLAAERQLTITRDSTQPTLSVSAPAAGALVSAATLDVSGSATDAHLQNVLAGGVLAQLSGSSFLARGVPLAEGDNPLQVVARDRAGNERTVSRTVVRDSTAPVLTIGDPAAGTVVPGAAYTVRGTATDAHLDRVEVNGRRATLAGAAWQLEVALAEGDNPLEVVATDRLGQRGTASVILRRDSAAPQVLIQQPAEGFATPAAELLVRGVVAIEEGVTVKVNGLQAVIDQGHFEVLAPLAPGENRLVARAKDAQGNEGVHSRLVYRDQQAPSFVRVEPAAGALALPVAASFRLTFSEELAPPAEGELSLTTGAGAPLAFTSEILGAELVLTPQAALPPQTVIRLTLTAQLGDRAGNALAPVPAPFEWTTVDTGAPAAPTVAPAPPAALCAASLLLTGQAESLAQVRAEGGAATALARATEDGAFSVTVELLPERLNLLRLVAIDALGNVSPQLQLEVAADCTPPRVLSAELAGAVVEVTFSENVVAPAAAFSLNSAAGSENFAFAAAGSGATLTLAAPPSGLLALTVQTTIADLAGNTMVYPWQRLFGAGAGDSFLAGAVFDDATGQPLAGVVAAVTATGGVLLAAPLPQMTTGEDGRFLIGLAAGTHDVTFARPGYAPVFRVVTTVAGEGAHVFAPRLTPLRGAASLLAAGGEAADGLARLVLPAGALAAAAPVSLTQLGEQALPALLPYGWSPRGAAWVEIGASLALPATLTLPTETALGRPVVIASLDFALLQWRALELRTVTGASLEFDIAEPGAYVVLEADAEAALSPVAGQVLPSLPAPSGEPIANAAIDFLPGVVLPSQRSLATVSYGLAGTALPPSGTPLSLAVQERLTLLDGSERRTVPYQADLLVYRDPDGEARSRFYLQPSPLAASLPIELGVDQVTVRTFGEVSVRGNVLGPDGGSVLGADGDLFEVPAGALTGPTAVLVQRRPPADLPLQPPAGFTVLGVLAIELGGQQLDAAGRLTLATAEPPVTTAKGLLLGSVEVDGELRWRALAALEPVTAGWRTAAAGGTNPPWPGVREGGAYLAIALDGAWAQHEGQLYDADQQLVERGLVNSTAVPWLQLSIAEGRFVLPLPAGEEIVVAARDQRRDRVAVALPELEDNQRYLLDLELLPTGPTVVELTPADGAANVPVTFLPTVSFSESVDRATLAAGLRLLLDGEPVAVDLNHQDQQVTVEPVAPLRPDTSYQLEVNSAIRDLQGRQLAGAVVAAFRTTAAPPLPPGIDGTKVKLYEPDSQGLAKVVGLPGAVPAASLLWVESVETITITAASDGSFELEIPAEVGDTLYLSVLMPGQSSAVHALRPWLLRQGSGAYIGPEGGRFTSEIGLEVIAAPGTFSQPTRVTVAAIAAPIGHHASFTTLLDFQLDLGGAVAKKPLELRLPAPAGAPSGSSYLLNRYMEALGRRGWMVMDQLQRSGNTLTNGAVAGPAPIAAASVVEVPAGRFEVPSERVLDAGEALELRAGLLNPRAARPLAIQSPPAVAAKNLESAPQAAGGPNPLPGPRIGGTYQATTIGQPINFYMFPGLPDILGVSLWADAPPFLARVLDELQEPSPRLYLPAMPDGASTPLQVVDSRTGYTLYDEVLPPSPDPVEIPASDLSDEAPPEILSASPLLFQILNIGSYGVFEVRPGIHAELTQDQGLEIFGEPGSVAPLAQVKLWSFDNSKEKEDEAEADGSFSLMMQAALGERVLLAAGGRVGPSDEVVLRLSEPLAELDGVELYPVTESGAVALEPVGARKVPQLQGTVWSLVPEAGWRAGSYQLRITNRLEDEGGNYWPRDFDIEFEVPESSAISSFDAGWVADFERIGNLLAVVSQTDGLRLFDVSDPAQPRPFLHEQHPYRFAGGGAMRGVAADRHGRLVVVGSGEQFPGQLHVVDPLVMDRTETDVEQVMEDAVFGFTSITDSPLGQQPFPIAGLPRKVATLNRDQAITFKIGEGLPELPEGLEIQIQEGTGDLRTVTITGSTEKEHAPVSLRNTSRGRWKRVYSDEDKQFSLVIEGRKGDSLQLARGNGTWAYATVDGFGLVAVDLEKTRGGVLSEIVALSIADYTRGYAIGSAAPCGPRRFDIDRTPIDVAVLGGTTAAPALVTLVKGYGLALFSIDPGNPGELYELSAACGEVDEQVTLTGMAVAERYPIDLDGNGRIREQDEVTPDGDTLPAEIRDYVAVTHGQGWLLIFDVTQRAAPQLVSKIKIGPVGESISLAGPSIDRANRRIYVSAFGQGIFAVGFDRLQGVETLDADGDGHDDRVLEGIKVGGAEMIEVMAMPELGVIWGVERQGPVSGISVAGPEVKIVAADSGPAREVVALAPFGVPTRAESAAGEADRPGSFLLQARLASSLPELSLDVFSIGPEGQEIAAAGWGIEGLPQPGFRGEDAVPLERQAQSPWEEGYNLFLSPRLVAIADLRAAIAYEPSPAEKGVCNRCDQVAAGIYPEAPEPADHLRELLSGHRVKVAIPAAFEAGLAAVYGDRLGDGWTVASVPWAVSPPTVQESPVSSAFCASGEFRTSEQDLEVPGRGGAGISFGRVYRSATVGAGPLGPGWGHAYELKVRELPNGDVELIGADGRRDTFVALSGGGYQSPVGRFENLVKAGNGFRLTDVERNILSFDNHGRLTTVADAAATGPESGNQTRLAYDGRSRLASIEEPAGRKISLEYGEEGRLEKLRDFDGQAWDYGYDPNGQLISVTSPSADLGEATQPVVKGYSYSPGAGGDLRERLNQLGQLKTVKKPDGQAFLDLQFADRDGDGLPEELVAQGIGPGTLGVDIDRETRIATITDQRNAVSTMQLNAACQPTWYQDPTGATWTYTYNPAGQMTGMVEPLGRITNFLYAGPNLLQASVTADSRLPNGSPATLVTNYTYAGGSNQPTRIAGPDGTVTVFARNPAGQPVSVTRAFGTADAVTETFQYDAYGQVVQHVDGAGTKRVFVYDLRGYPVSERVDPDGADVVTRFETNSRGQVTAVIDELGRRSEIEYNALGWKTATYQAVAGIGDDAPPLDYPTRWAYDVNGNVRQVKVPYGDGSQFTRIRFEYGWLNELKVVRKEPAPDTPEEDWLVESRGYDANLNLTSVWDAEGNNQQMLYDPRNLPVVVTRGLGDHALDEPITEEFVYDAERQLVTWFDGRGKIWSQAYDGYGRLARQTDPLGNYSTTEYDAIGLPAAQKAFDASETLLAHGTATYDRLGRRKTASQLLWDPADEESVPRPITNTFGYDGASRLRLTIDAKGRATEKVFDSAGRLFEVKDPAGNRQTFTYDAAGQVASMTRHELGAGGVVTAVPTSFAYDAAGRLAKEVDALGNIQSFAYDARHQLVRLIDQEGFFTSFEYDGLGRQVREIKPEGIEVELEYDRIDMLVEYRDAKNQRTTYRYDAVGRQTKVTYPDTTTEEYEYDAGGNLVERKDALGIEVDHVYDDANRLLSRTAMPGNAEVIGPFTESYTWDGAGRLIRAQSGGLVSERTYDSLSRVTSETVGGREISWQLDDVGNKNATIYPSGYVVARSFDNLNRLNQISGNSLLAGIFEYRGQGALEKVTLGNGLIRQTTFDNLTRPLTSKVQKSTLAPVLSESFAWTPRSLKAAVARGDKNFAGEVFAYDGAGRLLGVGARSEALAGIANNTVAELGLVAESPDAEDFLYDEAQNLLRRKKRKDGIVTTIASPPDESGRNRPASIGGRPLEWDANGNLRRKDGLRFNYDWRNRLREVKDVATGALVASYEYDTWNRRIGKTVGSEISVFSWDGWNLVEVNSGGGLLRARNLPGLSLDNYLRFELNLDGVGEPEQSYVPLYDSTGNLVALTDSIGKPVERYDYSAFGLQRIFVDATPPEIVQVRKVGGTILVEFSEEVSLEGLREAAARGDISLEGLSIEIEQPVQEGPLARRRVAITTSATINGSTEARLTIGANAVADSFLNRSPAADAVYEFPWSTQGVIEDTTAPKVERVGIRGGKIEIDFTEAVDLAAVTQAITIDGSPSSWTLDPAAYRVILQEPLAPGGHAVVIGTLAIDLAAKGLTQAYSQTLTVGSEEFQIAYQAPDPREVGASSVGNAYGFQGLPKDSETGLIYVRNRYYDPELGRFISADPLGFIDGPSMYSFSGSNPYNLKDPMGLCVFDWPCPEALSITGNTIKNIATNPNTYSTVLGVLPVVGEIKDAQEALTGVDLITGEKLGVLERVVTVGAFFVPFIPGKVLRAGLNGVESVIDSIKTSRHAASDMPAPSTLLDVAPNRAPGTSATPGPNTPPEVSSPPSRSAGAADESPGGKVCSGAGCMCFVPGTLVLMADGGTKAIEQVQPGDMVIADDPADQQEPSAYRVLEQHLTSTARVFRTTVSDSNRSGIIESTGKHPFWTMADGWKYARDLVVGDQLLAADGRVLMVTALEVEDRDTPTFNLTVDQVHTYFVVAEGLEVLVHNTGGEWVFDPSKDVVLDLPNNDPYQKMKVAVDAAFERTGVPRDQFEVTKWAEDKHGKTFPVEWRAPSGAEVSIDDPPLADPNSKGPKKPHVGYQTGGKRSSGGAKRGHIMVDELPVTRARIGCQ